MIRKICVLTPEYPSDDKPYMFTFVDQLVCAIADQGIEICVITPHDMLKYGVNRNMDRVRVTPNGNKVQVYSPSALCLSTRKLGPINLSLLSGKLFVRAALKALKKNRLSPDIIYSHFLCPAGTAAAEIGERLGVPSACAFGESSLWSIREIGLDRARKKLAKLTGILAVSTNNKKVLTENRLISEDRITVIPNAVNKQVFCPGDKAAARARLNLPQDRVIGLFNGSFIHSKGPLRVAEAAKGIDGLSMIYLGGGEDEPQGADILYKGRVAHQDVATWLKAADFFVLPTLEEGCCNAIVEAMSTGLPVITSDLPFNQDILDRASAMLIDPMDTDDLHRAMKDMTRSPELRSKYSAASMEKSADLDIRTRAERIIAWLNRIRQEYAMHSGPDRTD